MSSLSFRRRRILDALARTLSSSTDSWSIFSEALGDHSMGAKWRTKKDDILSRMAQLELVERVEVAGARESHWRITDKGRRTLSRAQARSA